MTGHTAEIFRVDWSPDGTRLATASGDGTARISEIADGGIRELVSFSAQDMGHGVNGLAFSPDGQRLMTGDMALTAVKIWDASANRRRRVGERADGAVPAGDATPHGRLHA